MLSKERGNRTFIERKSRGERVGTSNRRRPKEKIFKNDPAVLGKQEELDEKGGGEERRESDQGERGGGVHVRSRRARN